MNQEKTGAFIAKRRKELNLTQKELAEKLGITDRAVSKWENGRCMPDLSLLQPLSRILKVGVNDLLSGEIISEKEYRKKSETNIIGLVDLNILKSFRYGYFWFYILAVLLLIYCLIKNVEYAGVLALILAYSTAMYYYRYRIKRDVLSAIIIAGGILGTVTSLIGSVCFGLKYMAPCQIGYTISTVPDTVGREVNNYLDTGLCGHLRQLSILLHFS